MLVLSRKEGEGIVIGDGVRVTVVRIAGGVVRVGVEAPEECVVVRGELLTRQEQQDEQPAPPGEVL